MIPSRNEIRFVVLETLIGSTHNQSNLTQTQENALASQVASQVHDLIRKKARTDDR